MRTVSFREGKSPSASSGNLGPLVISMTSQAKIRILFRWKLCWGFLLKHNFLGVHWFFFEQNMRLLPSLKLTANSPENRPKRPNRKGSYSNHPFSGAKHVSFRDC